MLVKDQLLEYTKPAFKDEMRQKLNQPENFFKHANHDSGDPLEFNPAVTEFFLLDACNKYRELTGESVPTLSLFVSWYMLNHPNIFNLPAHVAQLRTEVHSDLTANGRAGFFSKCLPLISRLSPL